MDKQERRAARVRGAGPRELKNATFNFAFNAPISSPAKSPAKALPAAPAASPLKTPAPSTGKRKRPSTSKKTPAAAKAPSDPVDELSPDAPVPINEDELPQIRRYSIPILPLNKVEERPPPSPDRRPPREERGRSRTRKSIVSVSGYSLSRSRLDALEEEDEGSGMQIVRPSSTGRIESGTEGVNSTTLSGRRTSGAATFDGGTSAFLRTQAAQSTRREVYEIPDVTADEDEIVPASLRTSESRRGSTTLPPQSPEVEETGADEDELTPAPAKTTRRPRTSNVDILPDPEPESSINAAEDEDEISTPQTTARPSPKRKPLTSTHTNTRRARPDDDDKPRETIPAEPPRKKQKVERTKGGPTIPVTVYRRSKLPDDDPLGVDPDHVPSMHPSDVLSQIATEIVNGYMTKVSSSHGRQQSQSQGQTSKKALRIQMQALRSFRDNLGDSLRNITFARHSMFKFASEVRRVRKQKRDLREELMSRRKERDDLEIRIDQLRAEHEAKEASAQKQKSLVDDLKAIEDAVKRARAQGAGDAPESGIAAGLEDVRDILGMKERIGEFNGFLGEAATKL